MASGVNGEAVGHGNLWISLIDLELKLAKPYETVFSQHDQDGLQLIYKMTMQWEILSSLINETKTSTVSSNTKYNENLKPNKN